MESGSLTLRACGRLALRKVRIDCCGRRRSPSLGSGMIAPAATCGAKSGATVSSHCQGWTGSHRYAAGSCPRSATVWANVSLTGAESSSA
jgi:hypothetical protein